MRKHAWAWAVAGGLGVGLLAAAALNFYTRQPRPGPVAAEPEDEPGPADAASAGAASAEDAPRSAAPAAAPGPAVEGARERPRATPHARRALPFGPGETLVYDVAWSLVNAGTITMSLREERDERGAPAWRLSAEGQVAGALASLYALHYKAESLVDPDTLLPRRAVVYQQEGERRRTRVTVFDQAARRAHYEQVGGRQADLDTPDEVWDSLSVLYALRAAPGLGPGVRLDRAVCDSGRVYTVAASVGQAAGVDTPAGHFSAYQVTPVIRDAAGQPQTRGVSLWLSSDGRRLPVKIEIALAVGRFTVVLREVTSG